MLNFNFSGRTAIVTGGTRGIGAAVTAALIKAGANVIAIYASNEKAAQDFAASLGNPPNLETVKCNVADYDALETFFKAFDLKYDALDIVINCAGIRMDGVLAMMPVENWKQVIDINLTGTFNMFKLGVQRMLRKRYGRIIAISSIAGRMGIEGQANYSASKAAQVALTKSLAKEVAKRKITVNCIAPGFIDTDFISTLPEEQTKAYKDSVPLKRFGRSEDVANAALFLASEETEYITGSVIEIAGGL